MRRLLSLHLIDMYDHLPNQWGSLPELMIPELNEGIFNIAVTPFNICFRSYCMRMSSVSFFVAFNDASP